MTELDVRSLLQFVFDVDEPELAVDLDCQHLLHAYIEAELAGGNSAEQYPQVQSCIEADKAFRPTYEELKEVLRLEQQNALVEPPIPARLETSFFEANSPPVHKQYQLQWYLNELGHLIVHLTGQLVDSAKEGVSQLQESMTRQPGLIMAGELRSAPSQLPQFSLKGIVEDIEVEIQAKETKSDPTTCQIEVQVNIPSRGGWPNLGNIRVTLRQEDKELDNRLTNAFGAATFKNVALADLDYLVFEIAPPI